MECIRSASAAATPGRRDVAGAHHPRWSLAGRQGQLARPQFVFNANAHSRGRSLCRQNLREKRVAQGEAALADIARHPSREIHRHQIRGVTRGRRSANRLGGRLQEVFASRRRFKALTLALVDSMRAWQAPLTKLRNRTIPGGDRPGCWRESRRSRQLSRRPQSVGQPLWSPSGPNGFPTPMPRGRARGDEVALDISAQLASRVATRSIPAISSSLSPRRGVGGNAADHRTRRNRGSRRWRCC